MSAAMKTLLTAMIVTAGALSLAACNPQARGFALPPGDPEAGKTTFAELGCNHCHSVNLSSGETLNRLQMAEGAQHEDVHVVLGGAVTRVKTYGDLVTSIINPSHKLSRGNDPSTFTADGTSVMPSYNSVMTVEQMLDLTSLLQDSYSVWVPQYGPYYFP